MLNFFLSYYFALDNDPMEFDATLYFMGDVKKKSGSFVRPKLLVKTNTTLFSLPFDPEDSKTCNNTQITFLCVAASVYLGDIKDKLTSCTNKRKDNWTNFQF